MAFPEVIARYFKLLEAADFDGATDCFAPSARYSHPPYADDPPGGPRHEAAGRQEILALFQRRGPRATRHEITHSAQTGTDGDFIFIAGEVRDQDRLVASFVSHATLDAASGLIADYVAYSSRPPIWATQNHTSA